MSKDIGNVLKSCPRLLTDVCGWQQKRKCCFKTLSDYSQLLLMLLGCLQLSRRRLARAPPDLATAGPVRSLAPDDNRFYDK